MTKTLSAKPIPALLTKPADGPPGPDEYLAPRRPRQTSEVWRKDRPHDHTEASHPH